MERRKKAKNLIWSEMWVWDLTIIKKKICKCEKSRVRRENKYRNVKKKELEEGSKKCDMNRNTRYE